jgi:glucosamine--fructose-6-phosphate aminotransferase (isomerizing)
MDTARFIDDLTAIPEYLGAMADRLDRGIEQLETVPAQNIRRILILGMGSSFSAADVVAREARAQGVWVSAELASAQHLPKPAQDLLVVAVSATGESVEVVDACERYRGHGRLVTVTNRSDSTLGTVADAVIPMHAGVEVSGVACRTFRHTLVMLRAFLQGFGLAEKTPLAAVVRKAAEANAVLLDTRNDWLSSAADTLESALGTWVLAPVERQSSARQSALMMREVPRHIAYASETGDWSHVDVYLTSVQDYRALVFAGSRWDEPALNWMKERGSTFVAVGEGENGEPLPGAAQTITFPGQEILSVAQLTEPLIGELVAAHWHG